MFPYEVHRLGPAEAADLNQCTLQEDLTSVQKLSMPNIIYSQNREDRQAKNKQG